MANSNELINSVMNLLSEDELSFRKVSHTNEIINSDDVELDEQAPYHTAPGAWSSMARLRRDKEQDKNKKYTVKTKSGTKERVSRDDLKAAGDIYDKLSTKPRQHVSGETELVHKRGHVKAIDRDKLDSHLKDGWEITEQNESVELALEYFENYFSDTLNEDISDEYIMDAVEHLILLTEAVLEALALSTPAGIKTRITRATSNQ